MSILCIDTETTLTLYDQITSRHTIPGLTHELFVKTLVSMLAETVFEAGRFILGQLVMFQNHTDLGQALTACIYKQKGSCVAGGLNMLVKRYLFIYNNRIESMMLVHFVLDTYGKPREQMINDLAVMYDDSYPAQHGLANTILAQQYKCLVLDAVLLAMSRVFFYLLMIEPTGRIITFKQQMYIDKTYNKISSEVFDLARIPPNRRDAFIDLIYSPTICSIQTRSAYEKWKKQILDYKLRGLDGCCGLMSQFFTVYLYYIYGRSVTKPTEPPVDLIPTAIDTESLVVEI